MPGAANPQAWNRYSYVLNNPLRYTDPTGHYCVGDDEDCADEGGDGPAPTGTGGNNGGGGGGGNPHDDDDYDPNPDCVGCDGYGEDSITLTYDTQYIINNSFVYSIGTADQWSTASLWLDYLALGIDSLAGMIVLGHVAVGLAGGPEGAGAAYLAGELNPAVRGLVFAGNVVASGATFFGLVGSIKSGDLIDKPFEVRTIGMLFFRLTCLNHCPNFI